MPSLGGLVAALLASVIAVGCGSGSRSGSPSESLIPRSEVSRLFYRAHYPRRIAGLIPLVNLLTPLPFGDLDQYTFYRAKSPNDVRGNEDVATVTVFGSVRAARKASVAILRGGPCVAHAGKDSFAVWAACEHLRVRNVLLIMSTKSYVGPTIRAEDRSALVNVFRKLGKPTEA